MIFLLVLTGYLIGSIPFGYVVVKVFSGRDVREFGSGRTGGTNAMRAAGFGAGLLTASLDLLKASAAVWLAQSVLSAEGRPLGMALAGLGAILGHNYSLFLKFKGGAGGAACVGAALGIWPWSVLIAVPVGLGILYGVGYASLATLSVAVTITALFVLRTFVLHTPGAAWQFILYGLGALVLLAWALRPNIKRLLRGEERLVGWRAQRAKQAGAGSSLPSRD
jgi:acyl phosphate:glycerol-3-phosphate acyltransferase